MAKRGRKSTYTQEVADDIAERISTGETLQAICRCDGMPPWRTVYQWMEDHPEFAASIARARDIGYDAIAEDTLRIADDATNDYMERIGPDDAPGYALNGEHVQRSKLRIETRLKLLAKWSPKKYGERVNLDHSGKVGRSE